MKEFKTREELREWAYSIENTYESNRASLSGVMYYANRGELFDSRDFRSSDWIEDYFHKDFFIRKGHYYIMYTGLSVRNASRLFNSRDADTWIGVDPLITGAVESSDNEMVIANSKPIYLKRSNGVELSVLMSDEDLTTKGFIRGKVNTLYYFHKNEIKHLDTFLPYRKFDFTYSNQDLKKLERIVGKTKEYITDRVSKAFKDNIRFGTDSLTYKAFEGIENTFGVEIETCIGRIEDVDAKKLNLKAVHDGSLRDEAGNTPGGEYVTGVLKGDAGLAQLYEICRVISTKCKVNQQCGRVYATFYSNIDVKLGKNGEQVSKFYLLN